MAKAPQGPVSVLDKVVSSSSPRAPMSIEARWSKAWARNSRCRYSRFNCC